MEFKEVKTILKRIETNYQNFVNDAYTQEEWYKELKDYEFQDVMEKLELHFRSEQFGNQIPKVYFLTKYLTKTKDKGKYDTQNIITFCQICGERVRLSEYEKHYHKCSAIEYLDLIGRKYYDKSIDKEKYRNMNEKDFEERYYKSLYLEYENTNDKEIKQRIENIMLTRKKEENTIGRICD